MATTTVYKGTLTPAQIAAYAYQAGFRGQALVTAVAIALAESGGKVNAIGDQHLANNKWGWSIGLWQIRSLIADRGTGRARDATRLRDPAFNARAAFEISNGGTNWTPWTVYKTGAYKRYLSQAQAAAASVAGGDAMAVSYAQGSTIIGDVGAAPNVDPRDAAKSLYGYLGWFVDHPEVGPIILQAAREGWDQMRLQGALARTHWWQNTSESARQWDALLMMDPATARRRIQETATSIKMQAGKLGIPMTDNQIFVMSVNALRLGWTPQEIQLAMAAQMKWNSLSWAIGGGFGQTVQEIRKLATDYMIPVTAKQAWQWARRIIGGAATIEAVQQQFGLLAAVRYPHLVNELGRGITPAQFFAPHRNAIAQVLEISPDDIDFLNDRKWRAVVSFKDPATRKTRAMTVTEAARFARMQPEWARTDNAWKAVTDVGDAILQIFGEVSR